MFHVKQARRLGVPPRRRPVEKLRSSCGGTRSSGHPRPVENSLGSDVASRPPQSARRSGASLTQSSADLSPCRRPCRDDRANLPARIPAGPGGPPRWARPAPRPPSSTTTGIAHTPARARAGRGRLDLGLGRRPLHRDQLAVRRRPAAGTSGPAAPGAPRRAPSPRRTSRVAGQLLGAAADHLDLVPRPSSSTTSSRKRVRRSSGSTSVTSQVRPGDRQHQPGQAGARADVGHASPPRAPARPAPRS